MSWQPPDAQLPAHGRFSLTATPAPSAQPALAQQLAQQLAHGGEFFGKIGRARPTPQLAHRLRWRPPNGRFIMHSNYLGALLILALVGCGGELRNNTDSTGAAGAPSKDPSTGGNSVGGATNPSSGAPAGGNSVGGATNPSSGAPAGGTTTTTSRPITPELCGLYGSCSNGIISGVFGYNCSSITTTCENGCRSKPEPIVLRSSYDWDAARQSLRDAFCEPVTGAAGAVNAAGAANAAGAVGAPTAGNTNALLNSGGAPNGGGGLNAGGRAVAGSGPAGVGNATELGGAAGGTTTARLVARSIDAGSYYSCAVLDSGSIRCWGANRYGELGDGTTTSSYVPVDVTGITNASAVSVDAYHVCALSKDGTIQCWGYNASFGQRADGTAARSYVPVPIPGIENAKAIAVGDLHTCAILSGGNIQCWGDNQMGSLGNGTTTNLPGAAALADVVGITDAVAIAADYFQTCALLRSGSIQCWGSGKTGQLGNSMQSDSALPVTVSGITDAIAVTAGLLHTCALRKDGTIQCWGSNACGELGNGTLSSSSVPVTVSGIADAIAVDAGTSQTCALLRNGTVRCWGVNELCSMTNATNSLPVEVPGLANAVAIATGYQHSCALLAEGSVQCWGYNYGGALGNGASNSSSATVPVTVSGF